MNLRPPKGVSINQRMIGPNNPDHPQWDDFGLTEEAAIQVLKEGNKRSKELRLWCRRHAYCRYIPENVLRSVGIFQG